MQNAVVVHVRDGVHDVYIGRARKGVAGPWGNPFAMYSQSDRDAVIERYRVYLWKRLEDGEVTMQDLAALHGKRLGCFCAPKPCHGDVLVRAAAWAYGYLKERRDAELAFLADHDSYIPNTEVSS